MSFSNYIFNITPAFNEVAIIVENYQNILMVLVFNAVISAPFVILCKNPIYSLLSLISVFLNTLFILLILNVEFLTFTFMIIYIGAIAILFLFVIMMFNLKKLRISNETDDLWLTMFTYFILVPKVYSFMCESVKKYFNKVGFDSIINNSDYTELLYIFKYKTNDILLFSDHLYTSFCFIFILIGVVLLTAMVGAIVLASSANSAQDRRIIIMVNN